MRIGERIRIARTRLGTHATQKWLGDQLHITPQAISEWERGNGEPEPDKYVMIRRALRITFAWLHTGAGDCPGEHDPRVAHDDSQDGMAAPRPRVRIRMGRPKLNGTAIRSGKKAPRASSRA